MTPWHDLPATPKKAADTNDHEYLRRHVDPVLMPLIEALLLYQPESIYDFIHDYVDDSKASRFHSNADRRVGYAKKLTHRRKMVEFMSTSVIPVMDDLAHQILREKPSSVNGYIKEIVAARLIVGSAGPTSESNQYENVEYHVNDRVMARYKGRPRFYPGVVMAIDRSNESFTIRYDDGKTEHNVHRLCLKPIESELRRKSGTSAQHSPRSGSNQADDDDDDLLSDATAMAGVSTSTAPPRVMDIVILIIGIDGAGKTTLLSTLQGDLEKEHVPSAGFTSATFQTETGSATFYDLGGGPAFRNVWTEYYADAHGIMFVVDSSDEISIQESTKILHASMSHASMQSKPLLLFANKSDQLTSWPEEQLSRALGLDKLAITRLLPCTAKPSANGNMVDDRLEQGLHWLLEQIHSRFDALDTRVKEDLAVKKRQDEERRAAQRARVSAWKEERERAQMALLDKPSLQVVREDSKKVVEAPEEESVIKCSNCTTAAAVTKCAASKWMPVCADCVTSLKSAAAGSS
ncbi:hypothetical protein Poli38472_006103 [Pythium oligandrum]|uniref:Tudor domain-containing protein n=1 Tax=Pythium oligandrum TaxID=41045 RepID=A0A8K1CSA7_PYTOL|nr:hypothetical protein Poli38472_006103 [Pythium oligandrum]|eukprot:TMW68635.1 hypothetical protein Poli38472_006103 [Pythium oligandrum]